MDSKTITRKTLVSEGGEVTADLMYSAATKISESANQIMAIVHFLERIHGRNECVSIEALASRIDLMANKISSYFDTSGDEWTLHELAHVVYPEYKTAERELEDAIQKACTPGASASAPPRCMRALEDFAHIVADLEAAQQSAEELDSVWRVIRHALAECEVVTEALKVGAVHKALCQMAEVDSFVEAGAALEKSGSGASRALNAVLKEMGRFKSDLDVDGAYYLKEEPFEAGAPARKAVAA